MTAIDELRTREKSAKAGRKPPSRNNALAGKPRRLVRPPHRPRGSLIAALDIGTSKITCLIAKLTPHAPQEVLRRRTHAVEVIGFSHTGARGMKAGNVVDLVEAEEATAQELNPRYTGRGCRSNAR